MSIISRINIDIFINIRNDPSLKPSQAIQVKSEYLFNNHKCFTEQSTDNFDKYSGKNSSIGYNSKWKNNSVNKKSDGLHNQHERLLKRPVIGGNNNSVHREFVSILNKITYVNEDKLLLKLKDVIKYEHISTYTTLLWDMMLRCPDFQKIYINIINLIRSENNIVHLSDFLNIWNTYILYKKWLPDNGVCESITAVKTNKENCANGANGANSANDANGANDANDANGANDADGKVVDEYDEFCEFVKWKKRANAAINAFLLLTTHNIVDVNMIYELTIHIVTSCQYYINNISEKNSLQITNSLLEQMMALIKTFKIKKCEESKKYIQEFIKNNEPQINNLSPSIKFKFLDIIENLKQIDNKNNIYRVNR